MNTAARKPERHRERARIGADRARSWVRDFNLRNPYAKSILMAIANYMNEDGAAWPGLATLSRDTDITEDTIASRLGWCESIGVVVVLKCWVDEHGRRNYEKRGRPTSSEIRFVFDADIDVVEEAARATKGERPLRGAAAKAHASRGAAEDTSGDADTELSDSEDSTFSPRPPGGQIDEALPPVSTQLAPDQPPPRAVRSLELESESTPLPPEDGGNGSTIDERASEPTWPHEASWQRLKKTWDDPIASPDLCKSLWSAFTDIERERFIRVVRGYLAWRLKQPRIPIRMNLQRLMRALDSWPEYEKLAGPDPSLRTFVAENSREHRALQVIANIGHWSIPPITFDAEQGQRGLWKARPLKPDELAMETFFDKPLGEWTVLERNTKQFYAWSDRLFDWTGVRRDEPRVPCPFPPRKDGTFPPGNSQEESTGPPGRENAA